MAAYPTDPAFKTVSITPLNKTGFVVAESGVVRGTSLQSETAFRLQILHPLIDSAERTTLQNFYASNKTADNTISPIDGNTYDVNFETDYSYEAVSATYFNARVTLIGTRQ